MDRLVCVGLSYRTAPVEIRGRVDARDASARSSGVSEHILLRTCYRIELYGRLESSLSEARSELLDAFRIDDGALEDDLLDHLYVHVGDEAARHLCKVAAGLDSLVLGETEVLGQVSKALEASAEAGTSGPAVSLLFRSAIAAGRRARTETTIASNPATASSMALSLAERTLGDLRDKQVLVIGAGTMGVQALTNLTRRRVGSVVVASRSRRRATEVAERFGAAAIPLTQVGSALATADVVIAATKSDEPVVTCDAVRAHMSGRSGRPMVIVDLAVPADVEPDVGAIPGVGLFNVDDLRVGLDEAMAARMREVPRVEAIIEDEVAEFARRYRELAAAPLVAALRRRAEALRRRELERVLNELGQLDPSAVDQIDRLTRTIVTKLLHDPTARLKERAGSDDSELIFEVARELFALDAGDETVDDLGLAQTRDPEPTY